MGNEIAHYFGAYLEIKMGKVEKQKYLAICKNGHRGVVGRYCARCGEVIEDVLKTVLAYPTWSDLLGDEWEGDVGDILAFITPPKLHDAGILIAVGNLSVQRGEWLYLDRWNQEVETKEFPTEDEICEMIREFETNYENIITAVRCLPPGIESVTVKAGYVLNAEY